MQTIRRNSARYSINRTESVTPSAGRMLQNLMESSPSVLIRPKSSNLLWRRLLPPTKRDVRSWLKLRWKISSYRHPAAGISMIFIHKRTRKEGKLVKRKMAVTLLQAIPNHTTVAKIKHRSSYSGFPILKVPFDETRKTDSWLSGG